jgi:hypothetical protein
VYGIERDPGAAAIARKQLDAVFEFDVEQEMPPLEAGSLDCIIYGDVLEHLVDPWSLLERHRELVSPSGRILCSIPNVQHHSVLRQIARGDFQYQEKGLLDETHLRFFTFATAFKMLLDAGFEPQLVDTIDIGGGDALIEAAGPLLDEVRADRARSRRFMNAQQMIITGRPLASIDQGDEQALTFVACVNDEEQLRANLLRSPCLRGDSPHEVLLYRGCRSAAEGLNEGIRVARNDLVIIVHQDVYLPRGWPGRLRAQWRLASQHTSVGIAGVFGSRQHPRSNDGRPGSNARGLLGRVVDRDYLHSTAEHDTFPCETDYLDELLMVVPRSTPLSIDPDLGWHLYGTDLCMQARRHGLTPIVIDALCMHNTLTGAADGSYRLSEDVIVRKWPDDLPIHTVVSTIYGSPERRLMERIEAERGSALAELERVEVERDQAQRELERVGAEREGMRAELERARLGLASMEASRTWRTRNKIKGAIGRFTPSVRRRG